MAKMVVDIEISLVGEDGERISGSGYYEYQIPDGELSASEDLFDGSVAAWKEAMQDLECELQAEEERQKREKS